MKIKIDLDRDKYLTPFGIATVRDRYLDKKETSPQHAFARAAKYVSTYRGKTDWDNVVTACSGCNVKKGGRLLQKSGMTLNQKPYQPTTEDLHKNGRNFPPNFLHKTWIDYLYWDVELEP